MRALEIGKIKCFFVCLVQVFLQDFKEGLGSARQRAVPLKRTYEREEEALLDQAKLTRRSFAKLSPPLWQSRALWAALFGARRSLLSKSLKAGKRSAAAHSNLLPWLRQDGMRRVGDRAGRPRGGNGGGRVVVPIDGELLLEIEGVAAGGVSP